MRKWLKIHPSDNVLVALQQLAAGETVFLEDGSALVLNETIPAKHKFTAVALEAGSEVRMYGVVVGKVESALSAGTRITTGNTKHAAEPYTYRHVDFTWEPPDVSRFRQQTFMGYHRQDGSVGTANYWLFIPTVFCENRNLDVIRQALNNELGYGVTDKYKHYTQQLRKALEEGAALDGVDLQHSPAAVPRLFKQIDGIKFLNHQGGCGGTRQDAEMLGKLLAAYAAHPNVGGITILSLGCQNLQLPSLLEEIKMREGSVGKPLLVFEQQQYGSEEKLIADAIRQTFEALVELNKIERRPAPLSKLTLGVKCGGSDGFSGISANPAVGYCADLLVALGAKVLLAEFPELCGAEQNLIDRTKRKEDAEKFMHLMHTYSEQAIASGSGFHMNPSPGNIRDGLITDAMKSAGAAKKGGSSPVVDVLDYTEPARRPGLSLVCTPGNDVEATTGKAASGATLILFTTGLGTPTGNAVCPTIKLSSNSALAARMPDIIDINCGPVIDGEKTIEQMGEEILEYCIKAASGTITPKAVMLNQDDFIPWKRGVSL